MPLQLQTLPLQLRHPRRPNRPKKKAKLVDGAPASTAASDSNDDDESDEDEDEPKSQRRWQLIGSDQKSESTDGGGSASNSAHEVKSRGPATTAAAVPKKQRQMKKLEDKMDAADLYGEDGSAPADPAVEAASSGGTAGAAAQMSVPRWKQLLETSRLEANAKAAAVSTSAIMAHPLWKELMEKHVEEEESMIDRIRECIVCASVGLRGQVLLGMDAVYQRVAIDKSIKDYHRLMQTYLRKCLDEKVGLALALDLDEDQADLESLSEDSTFNVPVHLVLETASVDGKTSQQVAVYFHRPSLCRFLAGNCQGPKDTNLYSKWSKTKQQLSIFHPLSSAAWLEKPAAASLWLSLEGFDALMRRYDSGVHAHRVHILQEDAARKLLWCPYTQRRSQLKPEARYMQDLQSALQQADVMVECGKGVQLPPTASRKNRVFDLWCPDLQVDVECDEHGHKSYGPEYRLMREADIRLVYPAARFFYFDPHDVNFDWDQTKADILALCKTAPAGGSPVAGSPMDATLLVGSVAPAAAVKPPAPERVCKSAKPKVATIAAEAKAEEDTDSPPAPTKPKYAPAAAAAAASPATAKPKPASK